MNPHAVTRELEAALCEYTHSLYAVVVTSCTMALLLAVAWWVRLDNIRRWSNGRNQQHTLRAGTVRWEIEIPKRTYVGVPMSIIHAGGWPTFRDEEWIGGYQLKPLPVYDYARRFTSGMYFPGHMDCVSFHASKILGDTQGGAILHDDPEADAWFRRARFDGRTAGVAPKDDDFDMLGWHCYISPDVSARLLWKLSVLPKHNADLPIDAYPDLSLHRAFK